MARSVQTIKQQMRAQLAADSVLSTLLTSPSLTAVYNLWLFLSATAINIFEQAQDLFIAENESVLSQSVSRTAPWIQRQILNFQYGDIVQVDPSTFKIVYPTVDATKRIISNCAVMPASGIINIKVATGSPPAALSSPQKTALLAYANTIMGSGSNINIISKAADVIQIWGTVFYDGQDTVIQTSVENALVNYLRNIPFNGSVKISDIEATIRAVQGVTDWLPSKILATPSGGSPVYMINTNTIISRNYQTNAGYIVNDSAPNDFANTITYSVAQN